MISIQKTVHQSTRSIVRNATQRSYATSSASASTSATRGRTTSSSLQSTPLLNTTTKSSQQPKKHFSSNLDPHQAASQRITNADTSISSRIDGVDALQQITPQQKMQNYGLALLLMGFCGSVYSYSISSVGKAEVSIEDLKEEAKFAEDKKAAEARAQEMQQDLAQVDVTLANTDTDDEDGMIVAVAAPEEIAEMEEQAQLAGKGEGKKKPLWKKIVFFWRK